MTNVNVKEVNGGEATTPDNSTDGVLLDNGTTSKWISVANFAVYVWGYLTSLTAKTTPVDADTLGINDSAASNVGKKVTLANFAVYVWGYLTSLTAKTTLVDADTLGINDSAASDVGKKITWANVMAQILAYTGTFTNKTFTTPTIADFTNANHDHLDTDDGGLINRGYTLQVIGNGGSPADSTTYYFGNPSRVIAVTVAGNRRTYIPMAGTLTRADIAITNAAGTVGTAETSTLYFRLNNTTDTTLSSAIVNNQASESTTYINTTGLSTAVATGDYFELKWVTPAWVTNPTVSVINVILYITT